jgi:hypothetical protein
MKKSLFFFAAAALALTACSNDDATQQAQATAAPQAVAFDIYTSGTTRAGDAGIQTTSTLQASGKGFGVFAVQSDNTKYAQDLTTNFMWNEHVTYGTSAWAYSPLKYWPNETDNDSQSANAESDNIDRLSFFAYAPYVAEVTSTYDGSLTGVTYNSEGKPTKAAHNATDITTNVGILGVNANNENTIPPFVWYKSATKPSESVDLLWGVAPAGGLSYTSVAAGLNNTDGVAQIATGTVTVAEGMPLVDLIKPVRDEKIKFLFKHALARLGVTVVAAIDQISPGGNFEDTNADNAYTTEDATHVAVESIVINASGTNKLYTEGRLNLKNEVANQSLWEEKSGAISALTINEDSELSKEILWKTNPETTLNQLGFNGVDKTERIAMRSEGVAANAPVYFMLIPSHLDTELTVTITYYVFTKDLKLSHATYGTYAVTKNVISKVVTIPGLTNNKAYNLKLILGLTSVKLDAEVADWDNAGSTPIDLPQNKD